MVVLACWWVIASWHSFRDSARVDNRVPSAIERTKNLSKNGWKEQGRSVGSDTKCKGFTGNVEEKKEKWKY